MFLAPTQDTKAPEKFMWKSKHLYGYHCNKMVQWPIGNKLADYTRADRAVGLISDTR